MGITRDPATLMLGQYFKGKRAHVEIILVAGSGIGISFGSSLLQLGIRSVLKYRISKGQVVQQFHTKHKNKFKNLVQNQFIVYNNLSSLLVP